MDATSRIVVPRSLLGASRLRAGQEVDITFVDGRLEIDVPALAVVVSNDGGSAVATPVADDVPLLTADLVREVLEETRR